MQTGLPSEESLSHLNAILARMTYIANRLDLTRFNKILQILLTMKEVHQKIPVMKELIEITKLFKSMNEIEAFSRDSLNRLAKTAEVKQL